MQPMAKPSPGAGNAAAQDVLNETQSQSSFSHVRWATQFVEQRVDVAIATGNTYQSHAFRMVLQVLNDVDFRTDPRRYRTLCDAFDFLTTFTDDCLAAGSEPSALRSYMHLIRVIAAIDIARKEEAESGQLCSLARVEALCGGQHAPMH